MVVILPYCIKAKRCEHNALGYWSGCALCLTKVRSSRARWPATALIFIYYLTCPEMWFSKTIFAHKPQYFARLGVFKP